MRRPIEVANAHHRRKQPDLIRRGLLDCAATLAREQGLGGLNLQAVAEAAGVTKGGLLHHFPNKQALIEAVVADLLRRTDAEIDAGMATDPEPRGRFTRAYVDVTFADTTLGAARPWTALYVSMIAEPGLRRLWNAWFAGRLERHRATDGDPACEVARLAADGAWLAHLMREEGGPAPDLAALRLRLIAMTRGAE